MKQAINCDDSPPDRRPTRCFFLRQLARFSREQILTVLIPCRGIIRWSGASINPRHDQKRGETAREEERRRTRGRGSLFTLAARGIDDSTEKTLRSSSCPRRACMQQQQQQHPCRGVRANGTRGWTRVAITRVSKDARLGAGG